VKPRGGEGQNGRLKCPMGFLVELKFGKKIMPYIDFLPKVPGYPEFSFWVPVDLAKICFSRTVMNCAKISLY